MGSQRNGHAYQSPRARRLLIRFRSPRHLVAPTRVLRHMSGGVDSSSPSSANPFSSRTPPRRRSRRLQAFRAHCARRRARPPSSAPVGPTAAVARRGSGSISAFPSKSPCPPREATNSSVASTSASESSSTSLCSRSLVGHERDSTGVCACGQPANHRRERQPVPLRVAPASHSATKSTVKFGRYSSLRDSFCMTGSGC